MPKLALAFAAALAVLAGEARADIPFLNATCPTEIEVHADKGGPIYINGHEAELRIYNRNAYDAHYRGITISLTINPDKSVALTYTRRNGANGICHVHRN